MAKFKSILSGLGEIATSMMDHQAEVNSLANKLMSKTTGVDYEQAQKIARVLINEAEVTWK